MEETCPIKASSAKPYIWSKEKATKNNQIKKSLIVHRDSRRVN
jgi:hypothetical protein